MMKNLRCLLVFALVMSVCGNAFAVLVFDIDTDAISPNNDGTVDIPVSGSVDVTIPVRLTSDSSTFTTDFLDSYDNGLNYDPLPAGVTEAAPEEVEMLGNFTHTFDAFGGQADVFITNIAQSTRPELMPNVPMTLFNLKFTVDSTASSSVVPISLSELADALNVTLADSAGTSGSASQQTFNKSQIVFMAKPNPGPTAGKVTFVPVPEPAHLISAFLLAVFCGAVSASKLKRFFSARRAATHAVS